jgi:hypothetical protein
MQKYKSLLNTISNYGDNKAMNIFHVDLLPPVLVGSRRERSLINKSPAAKRTVQVAAIHAAGKRVSM